jgi:hypothetical protein
MICSRQADEVCAADMMPVGMLSRYEEPGVERLLGQVSGTVGVTDTRAKPCLLVAGPSRPAVNWDGEYLYLNDIEIKQYARKSKMSWAFIVRKQVFRPNTKKWFSPRRRSQKRLPVVNSRSLEINDFGVPQQDSAGQAKILSPKRKDEEP